MLPFLNSRSVATSAGLSKTLQAGAVVASGPQTTRQASDVEDGGSSAAPHLWKKMLASLCAASVEYVAVKS